MTETFKIDGTTIAECVLRFRDARPHVHCITNTVAQHFTANVLLAAGATPSMTIATDEVGDFVNMADALLVNLGTMDPQRSTAIDRAIDTAIEGNKPWALDPVFVQASPIRLELAKALLTRNPTLMRCNLPELSALMGREVDLSSLTDLSRQSTIALTGKLDRVVSGDQSIEIANGSALMDRVTTMGCALTAVMIGFMAVEKDAALAATSSLVLYGLAGEIAEVKSSGPGTFVPHFLDALSNISADAIVKGAKIYG